MTRYRVTRTEPFDAKPDGTGRLVVDFGYQRLRYVDPELMKFLGIEEVEPEPTAIVYATSRPVVVCTVENGATSWYASFTEKDEAVSWARARFGEPVKVEDA